MYLDVTEADVFRDRQTISSILDANRKKPSPAGRYDWIYLQNPFGKARIWLVQDTSNNRPLGACAVLPRDFWIQGKRLLCYIHADFSIHPEYRSLGPTIKLNRASLTPSLSGEIAFSYDFPSRTMAAAHQWLKFMPLTSMHRYVRFLSLSKLLQQWLRTNSLATFLTAPLQFLPIRRLHRAHHPTFSFELKKATSDSFDDSFSTLDKCLSEAWNVRGVRNRDYLAWRYGNNPIRPFMTLQMRTKHELVGYGLLSVSSKGRWYVYDLFTKPDHDHMNTLLAEVLRQASHHEAEAVEINIPHFSPWISLLNEQGFMRRPGGPEVFVFTDPKRPEAPIVNSIHNWYLMEGDRDT